MGRSRGFALIVVLWLLVLISAISAYLIANARQETAIARNILTAASAEALADAGVAQAVFNQMNPVQTARWRLDDMPHLIRLAEGELIIRLSDERQKVNPNLASEALLAAIFEASGVERALARRLGASIADWIDSDNEPRSVGAEREQYANAGRTYAPPNAPLERLDELRLVLGLTPQIYAMVGSYLTIYTNTARPDGGNAPPVIQHALVLDSQRVTQSAVRAPADRDSIVGQQQELTADERDVVEPEEAQADAEAATSIANQAVIALEVTARTSSGGVFVRHAVLRLDPSVPKSYVILDWRRGDLAASLD